MVIAQHPKRHLPHIQTSMTLPTQRPTIFSAPVFFAEPGTQKPHTKPNPMAIGTKS
jgi:hypothetical protein